MSVEQRRVFRQTSFSGEPVIYRDELLPIGAPAIEALREILRLHPDIEQFSTIAFDPLDSSRNFNENNEPLWINRGLAATDHLKALSDSFYKSDIPLTFNDETYEDYAIDRKALAVTSHVELASGEKMQIPMIDFADVTPEKVELAREILRPEKGFLLKTDNSFHFWGLNLMTEQHWQYYLKLLMDDQDADQPLLDDNFLRESLKRGFSALRLFGYPGTEKPTSPQVIDYI